jgi:adenylate cyclase
MSQLSRKNGKPETGTAVARLEQARLNAEMVIAESALEGERRVTEVRVALCVMMGLSQVGVTQLFGEVLIKDPIRGGVVLLYQLFSIVAVFIVRTRKPDPTRSFWVPLPITLIDVGFLVMVAWRSWKLTGVFNDEMTAAACAVVLSFSVVRQSRFHMVMSTVLASAGYLLVCWLTGSGSAGRISFVLACFFSLGGLLWWTNGRVSSMFLELRKRDNLSRFLPHQVVDRIVKEGDMALVPVQREVTVLFSDIRGFTTLSETLPPQKVLALLDDYFGHMTQIVMAHEGMVNKFLGDGMLACWGVPDHTENHAELAMRAALDMRAKLAEINAWREQQGMPPLRIGIGLHTGVVAAGMLGGTQQHEYTIIGDAVNVASRVEGLTKTVGVDILVSESTWQRCGGRFQVERVGEEQVKGRREAVVLYALKGREPGPATVFTQEGTGS